jgi:hypothetical protein
MMLDRMRDVISQTAGFRKEARVRRILSEFTDLAPWICSARVLREAIETGELSEQGVARYISGILREERGRAYFQPGLSLGSIRILFWINDRAFARHDVFLPGFALPLKWSRRNQLERTGLLASLTEYSREIASALHLENWHLGWDTETLPTARQRESFARLLESASSARGSGELEVRSAGVPLAAGLCLAEKNGRWNPQVWFSGTWSSASGVFEEISAESLSAKARVSAGLGGYKLFVPWQNLQVSSVPQVPEGLELSALAKADHFDPTSALVPLLDELDAEPPDDATEEVVRLYYTNRQTREKATRVYEDRLLPLIIPRVRRNAPPRLRTSIRRLVLALSSPGLAVLLILALRPRSVYLVVSRESRKHLKLFEELLASTAKRLEVDPPDIVPTENDIDFSSILELCRAFRTGRSTCSANTGDGIILNDLTGGNKLCTEAALRTCGPGVLPVYLLHEIKAPGIVLGSEQLTDRSDLPDEFQTLLPLPGHE